MRGQGGFLGRARAEPPARLVQASLVVILLVGLIAAHCGSALTWDGASLLFAFLDIQDLSLPHHRYGVALLQLPTLLLSRHVSRVHLLELVFGLSYTLIPFLSAWASWQIVRDRRPRLVVWPLLWITVGALPGQLFFVTESLIVIHAIWPLLLVVLTGLSVRRGLLGVVLASFSFGLHPVAGPLLLLVGASAVACAVEDGPRRRELIVAAALLFALGLARVWVSLHDPYELSQAAVSLRGTFRSLRLPPPSVASAAVVPAALLVAHLVRPAKSGPLFGILAAMLVSLAVSLVPWARNPGAWQDALNYRFLAPFAAAPFLVAASIVAITRPRPSETLSGGDAWVTFGATLVFAVVLSIQSAKWLSLRRALSATLARSTPCLSMNALPACRLTALKWWPTPSYALLIQGRAPRALLLPGKDCLRRNLDRVIPVNPWYARPRDTGWFDLRLTGLGR